MLFGEIHAFLKTRFFKFTLFGKIHTFWGNSCIFKNTFFQIHALWQNSRFLEKIMHFLKTRFFKFTIFSKRETHTLPLYKKVQPFRFFSSVKIMASNTLGEFSDGEDDFVFEIDESLWSDPEADDIIRNINEEEVLARVYGNDDGEDDFVFEIDESLWSDTEADDIIRNINEEEVLARVYGNDDDDLIRNNDENEVLTVVTQTGRGEKRKNESDDESESEDDEGQYYYQLESRRKYHSKKFGMTATDHRVRFNNVLADRDLLESYESSLKIFHHLLEEVKEGMAPNDQVRFILRSEQLETPISLPFMPVERLTAERVYSELERVIQFNQEFRLNDTVTIDLNHVESPVGSRGKGKKRTTYNIDDYLDEKTSVVRIRNKDDLCLARALVVARAKTDNDPRYNYIKDSRRPLQREKAFDLHEAANVPLGPCGLNEVALFQQYLTDYQIVVISGDHNNSVIYPPRSSGTEEKPRSIFAWQPF